MKNLRLVFFAICILPLHGCGTLMDMRIARKETDLDHVNSRIDERSRQLTHAVVDISAGSIEKYDDILSRPEHWWSSTPTVNSSVAALSNGQMVLRSVDLTNVVVELSRDLHKIHLLAEEDLRLEGMPIKGLDLDSLLPRHPWAGSPYQLKRFKQESTWLLQDRAGITSEIESLEKQRQFKGFWNKIIALIGIPGLIIVLLVFCPGLILPLVGWITGKIPKLINVLGVVSKNVADNLITGVEQTREALGKDPQKTYTAAELLKMIDQNMNAQQDETTKAIVWQRKVAHELKQIQKKGKLSKNPGAEMG